MKYINNFIVVIHGISIYKCGIFLWNINILKNSCTYIHNYNCLYEQIIFLLKKERKLLSNGKKHQTKFKLQPPTLQSYYHTRSSPLISLLYLGTYLLVRPVYFCLRIIVCSLFSLAYNYGLFKKISKIARSGCNFG